MTGAGDDGQLGARDLLGQVARPGQERFVELADDDQRGHADRRQRLDHVTVHLGRPRRAVWAKPAAPGW